MVNGERHCPNKNSSFADKMALISSKKSEKQVPHQMLAVSASDDTDKQDLVALEDLTEEEAEIIKWTIEEYMEGLSDVTCPPTSDELSTEDVAEVQLIADPSSSKRVHVPLNLRQGEIRVPVMGFFDTGSMKNLIDDTFAKKHHLKLRKKGSPLRTSAFNSVAGEDIWWEWEGKIEAIDLRGTKESYDIILNVIRLSGHEIIIGYPWMGKVGCSMVMKGAETFVTLGHLLVAAVTEQHLPIVDCELRTSIPHPSPFSTFHTDPNRTTTSHPLKHIMNVENTTQNSSPFQIMISQQAFSPPLIKICNQYSHIFFSQDSVLPPHRSFDICIEIKDNCEAPFGGLYNLALTEQIELKSYLN